jgi:hydroxymethylglutaryl-CoA lyase
MTASTSSAVELVEVGPRDGFQAIDPFIPTARKIDFVRRLVAAGLRRIEVGSVVSKDAVPQLSDTADLLSAIADIDADVPADVEKGGAALLALSR